MTETHNRGTGAGGDNGIAFENKTDNEIRLISNGFVRKTIPGKEKSKYYLQKIYATQICYTKWVELFLYT